MIKISDKVISWLPPEEIEPAALDQIKNISELPFIFRHVAVMPDCHLGKGATVGSVIATQGAIIPAAVGVDIGCGMIAVKTLFTKKDLENQDLDKLRTGIERRIPLGVGAHNKDLAPSAREKASSLTKRALEARYAAIDSNWMLNLGTLGSGNHFIELSLDEEDNVWAIIHSGSRGIGNRLATKNIKIAQQIMDDNFITLKDKDLAYLPENNKAFDEYLGDLKWSQEFAMLNRDEMMDQVLKELSYFFFGEDGHQKEIEKERINCHHNFTQKENHMGQDVWITRKGAIEMKTGQMGIIPGSMGTASYIVEGLECIPAYHSAPHGAGRKFSRTEAKKQFTMDDMDKAMVGISHNRDKAFLDEIPGAYKDIDHIMDNSKDLVKIVHTLHQIINIKGN